MADVKKGGVFAAIFAAGMAAGGGGVGVMNDPDPTSYIAAGLTEVITEPCIDTNAPDTCAVIRKFQLGRIVEDLKADVAPGETFPLSELDLYIAQRITYEDSGWEGWVQEALATLSRRLADGYANKDISPDDTLSGEALVAMMEAARDA